MRNSLAEYDMPSFCFSEGQNRAGDGAPASTTSFYISDVQLEWARERLTVDLLARAADDVAAGAYRAALEDRGIGYATSQLPSETLFFVAEVDVEAARRVIDDVRNGKASIEASSAPESPAPPRGSYLLRHWRGELTLPVSLWISWGGAALVGLVFNWITTLFDPTHNARAWALSAIAHHSFRVIASTWLLVGVWRSSRSHVARGGSPLWAGAARVFVVLIGILAGFSQWAWGLPRAMEDWNMAFGPSEIAATRIRLIRDGTEIEVYGDLGYGVTQRFIQELDAHPGVRIVHLNSPGGRPEEGQAMAQVIQARELTTYVATKCTSACVLPFSAGRERWLSHDAVIGLHAPRNAGMIRWGTSHFPRSQAAFLLSRGVDRAFVERGFATPPQEMWYPTHDEILAAHLATGDAPPGSVGLSGYSDRRVDHMVETLADIPLYAALREADREAYDDVVARSQEAYREGRTIGELRAQTRPRVGAVVRRSLPHASNAALKRYAELLVAEGHAVQNVGAVECATYFSEDGALGTLSPITIEFRDRERDAFADVIRSAQREPVEPLPLRDQRALLDEALSTMPPGARRDLDLPGDRDALAAHPDLYCTAIIAFYEAILARSDDELGVLMRAIFAAHHSNL